MNKLPFWKNTPLNEMTGEQWESLCDGCARCCLIKLEDEDSEEICTTSLACRYLDMQKQLCTCYEERTTLVPTCVKLTPDNIQDQFHFMPQTCAYRLIYEGQELPEWHPLLTGNRDLMQESGISIRHIAVSETVIETEEDMLDYIIDCDED
ncbi:MAG: YcgN family cysteine cluster protein [Gammaproteobacteria bacterium]|nr:YcgN family cysteine cluster protein [Gammaproteobacteria bacterium]